MTALPTPGAYLKLRRTAALLDVHDVAALLATDPRTPEHLRAEQIELIEADVQPITLATAVALHAIYPFEIDVLVRLAQLAQGQDVREPRLCRLCGWGYAFDTGSWPILGLCASCYAAESPERLAEYQAEIAARAGPTA